MGSQLGSPVIAASVNYEYGSAVWNIQGTQGWAQPSALSGHTDWFSTQTYNLSIPTYAQIISITVIFSGEARQSGIGTYITAYPRLIVGGAITGIPTGTPVLGGLLFGGTIATITGTPTEWGVPALTVAQINASNFGCAISGDGFFAPKEFASIGNIQIKVTYTEGPFFYADVNSFASIGYASTAEVKAIVALAQGAEKDIKAFVSIGFGVTITSPAAGCPAFTDANVHITWTISSGIQAGFRVQVYRDNLGALLVYDSGQQAGPDGSWYIPPGSLPAPETLYVRVVSTNADGGSGSSDFACFTTSFPTSVNITGVNVEAVGGCDDPEILPGIRVKWDVVAPGGGETFLKYGIRRRQVGETNFILIGETNLVNTAMYIDYNVLPQKKYEYSVIWIATSGASFLISANQATVPGAQVDFEFNFIHTASIGSDDADFHWLRVDSWEATVNVQQDIKLVQPWGRDLPTVHVGQAIGSKISLPLHDKLMHDINFWKGISDLVLQQRDNSAVMCLRFGRGRQLYFGVIMGSSRTSQQVVYSTQLDFSESFFDEDLTPGQHAGIGTTRNEC